ncbi:MAG: nitroreductase family protein [Symbiobacteriaceae bacterium]|nr:nitroreductase family protein [Symbiobacteriaceae bacterium]
MVEKIDLLFERRSIRVYNEGPVTKEQIEQLLKAGMAAATAGNRRPWHITVVQDPGLLQKLADTGKKACGMVPVVLVISGDKNRFFDGERVAVQAYWQQDCAAATQNILLAATAMGLGSLWMGVYPGDEMVKKVTEILDLPDNLVPFALVSIGLKGEEKEARSQYEEEQVIWK